MSLLLTFTSVNNGHAFATGGGAESLFDVMTHSRSSWPTNLAVATARIQAQVLNDHLAAFAGVECTPPSGIAVCPRPILACASPDLPGLGAPRQGSSFNRSPSKRLSTRSRDRGGRVRTAPPLRSSIPICTVAPMKGLRSGTAGTRSKSVPFPAQALCSRR
jgi:hypothetical protein